MQTANATSVMQSQIYLGRLLTKLIKHLRIKLDINTPQISKKTFKGTIILISRSI